MKKKTILYLPPETIEFVIRQEASFCASYSGPETSFTGDVNDFSDINEVDFSSIWNN